MHDIKWIRDHPTAFDRGLERRGIEPKAAVLIELDEDRRAAITALEAAQARRNAASKEIGAAKKAKDEATAQALMTEVAALKDTIPALEAGEKKLSKELEDALAQIPNLPALDAPDGKDEHDNVEHHRFGAKRDYAFTPKQHFELGEALGFMDFETATKLSGARFVVLKSGLARMERALGQFFLDVHTGEHGYTEVNPPLLVRDDVMFGTAQLPKFAEDQFLAVSSVVPMEFELQFRQIELDINQNKTGVAAAERLNLEFRKELERLFERRDVDKDASEFAFRHIDRLDNEYSKLANSVNHLAQKNVEYLKFLINGLWLIPTAEVPLTNLVRESILDEAELPLRFTACTPCFRAEAGAAGKDTRGMIRQHQFTKVELVSITTPEQSADEHERMLSSAEEVLRRLGLHYRVVTLCTGDMGFASQKTYDIEVWLPGQGMYREISSCSNCGEFQARRMHPPGRSSEGTRFRGKDGKVKGFVHTLNGSGVAVGRALIAVMETYQEADGSITVPDALLPYMGGMKKIARAS